MTKSKVIALSLAALMGPLALESPAADPSPAFNGCAVDSWGYLRVDGDAVKVMDAIMGFLQEAKKFEVSLALRNSIKGAIKPPARDRELIIQRLPMSLKTPDGALVLVTAFQEANGPVFITVGTTTSDEGRADVAKITTSIANHLGIEVHKAGQ